jgi:uncharacterized protein
MTSRWQSLAPEVRGDRAPARAGRFPGRTLAVIAVLLLTGCGAVRVTKQVASDAAAGNYAKALEFITREKQQYSGPNNFLYYVDRGALFQRLGRYQESSQELELAELLLEELYGTSITEAATSFLVNDMSLSYTGEDFEQVMINVLKALNYLYNNDLIGAGVEARKVDTLLLKLSDQYGSDAIYRQDAFARYLAAFAYEAAQDYNNAYIDYKKAYEAFEWYHKYFGLPLPTLIKTDLLRLSRWLGFDDEYRQWREKFGPDLPEPSPRPGPQSEVLLVVYDGFVPAKETRLVVVSTVDPDGHPSTLKVAFPVFHSRPNVVERVRVGLPDGQVAESELLEPLDAIAYQTLEQRIGAISGKAIARSILKFTAAQTARKAARANSEEAGLMVGLIADIFTWTTEQADTRSWRTLPNRFHVVRLTLPAGSHELEVRVETTRGATRSLPPLVVELKMGEKKAIPLYVPR